MLIDTNNVEALILQDKRLLKKLPEAKTHYDQWLFGKRVPAIRFIAEKAILQILESLNTRDNLSILEEYFQEPVSIRAIDYHVARSHKLPLADLEKSFNEMEGFQNYFCIGRDQDHAYISFWR